MHIIYPAIDNSWHDFIFFDVTSTCRVDEGKGITLPLNTVTFNYEHRPKEVIIHHNFQLMNEN